MIGDPQELMTTWSLQNQAVSLRFAARIDSHSRLHPRSKRKRALKPNAGQLDQPDCQPRRYRSRTRVHSRSNGPFRGRYASEERRARSAHPDGRETRESMGQSLSTQYSYIRYMGWIRMSATKSTMMDEIPRAMTSPCTTCQPFPNPMLLWISLTIRDS